MLPYGTAQDFSPDLQAQAVQAHQNAALLEPDAELLARGEEVIADMEQFYSDDEHALAVLTFEHDKLNSRKIGQAVTDYNFKR